MLLSVSLLVWVSPELRSDPVPVPVPIPVPGSSGASQQHVCAVRLLEASGLVGDGSRELPALYYKHASRKDAEFLEYMLSVIYVESKFQKGARSHAQAYGLMQMTLPAVQDAVTHCKLKPVLDMEHLLDSATNIRYGSCYLRKLLDEMGQDWTRTLIAYNGGYLQLQKYDAGKTITHETANYVLAVERARRTICNPVIPNE